MVTYYVGGHEAIYQPDGTSEIKRYIRDIAIHTIKSTGATTLHYVFNDHLGSGSVITDANGTIVETASFDAFGKRRDAKLWGGYANPFSHLPNLQALLNITQKGYTGHIQVDHASIIHMGGRIYDPDLGRFMQADPIVQDPRDAQSLNRYSYVYNNPLSYTDPTGYSTECGAKPGEVCPSAIEQQKAESAKAAQTQGSSKPEEVSKGNQSADLQNSAKKANGSTESELNTSDGWQYKGKTNGVDTYGKTYNRQDILNSVDDTGTLHLISEFTLPWDAATCLYNGCGKAGWTLAAITILPIGKYKKLDELSDVTQGTHLIPLTKAKFGHTFTTHGQETTEFLTKRAAGSGKAMGQFLDDQAAARLIQENLGNLKNGAISVPLPSGFPARMIMPDGSHVPASAMRLVPSRNGVKTAYPEL